MADFGPLRTMRNWLSSIASELDKGHNSEGGLCPFFMVDARNVVPCWYASDKLEYSARTIRTKVHTVYYVFTLLSYTPYTYDV